MAAFQILDFLSIVSGMVNHVRAVTRKITDFNPGSAARTLIEAPAIEIDQLYQQMVQGLRDAIPVSVYTSFQFERLAAQPARGLIRVTISVQAGAITIPAGATLTRDDGARIFASTAAATIAPGDTYADVPVAATTAGAATGAANGDAFTASPSPAGFVSALAQGDIKGGSDQETDDERKARFSAFIASLPRGTLAALEYGLKTAALYDANGVETERVRLVSLKEPYLTDALQPVGWVQAWIHNGSGATSDALVSRAAEVLHGYTDATTGQKVPGWKAAGVKVDVAKASEVAVALTAVLALDGSRTGADVVADFDAAASAYIGGLGIGETCVRAELIALAMAVPGVKNLTMSAPSADVTATISQKLKVGTKTLSAA